MCEVDDDFPGIAKSKDCLLAHVKESINMNLDEPVYIAALWCICGTPRNL